MKKHSTRNESVRTNLTLHFLSFQLCEPLVYFDLFIHEYFTFKTFSSGRHSRGCCDFVERPSYQTYWDTITNSSPIQFDGTELLWFGHAHYHVSWVPGSKIIKLCSSLIYLRAKNVKFYLEVAFLEDEVDNEINQIFISYHMLCILLSHNRWKQSSRVLSSACILKILWYRAFFLLFTHSHPRILFDQPPIQYWPNIFR